MTSLEQNLIDFYNYQIERLGEKFLEVQVNCLREEIAEFEEAFELLEINPPYKSGHRIRDELIINLEKEYADVQFCMTMIHYHLCKEFPLSTGARGALEIIAEDNMNKVRAKRAQGNKEERGSKLIVEGYDKKAVLSDVHKFVIDNLRLFNGGCRDICATNYLVRSRLLRMYVLIVKQHFPCCKSFTAQCETAT